MLYRALRTAATKNSMCKRFNTRNMKSMAAFYPYATNSSVTMGLSASEPIDYNKLSITTIIPKFISQKECHELINVLTAETDVMNNSLNRNITTIKDNIKSYLPLKLANGRYADGSIMHSVNGEESYIRTTPLKVELYTNLILKIFISDHKIPVYLYKDSQLLLQMHPQIGSALLFSDDMYYEDRNENSHIVTCRMAFI